MFPTLYAGKRYSRGIMVKPWMITPIVKFSLGISSFQHLMNWHALMGKVQVQDCALNLIDKDKDQMTVSLNKDRYYIWLMIIYLFSWLGNNLSQLDSNHSVTIIYSILLAFYECGKWIRIMTFFFLIEKWYYNK